MSQPLGGFGQGLPLPQNLFPSELNNAAQDFATNEISLFPGDVITVPAGVFWINEGAYSMLQFLDPISGTWRGYGATRGVMVYVKSDGANVRLANLTACPIGAVVANGGTGYTQATATITANVGGSTWQPVVGGALSVVSIAAAGLNYTMPPLVAIPSPQPGLGIPATAYATLTGTSVTGVTLSNVGAGYTAFQATQVLLLPNPSDPNFGSISTASVVMGLTDAGKITAALCTNSGASLASVTALTLTAAGGAGTGATVTPVILQTMTGASVTAAGSGYAADLMLTSFGGQPTSVSAIGNPSFEFTAYRPRVVNASFVETGGTLTSVGTIYDHGLFVGVPTALLLASGPITTAGSVTILTGGLPDNVIIQP